MPQSRAATGKMYLNMMHALINDQRFMYRQHMIKLLIH